MSGLRQVVLAGVMSGFAAIGWGQTSSPAPDSAPQTGQPTVAADSAATLSPSPAALPQKKTYTVPAGTKVLLQLNSAVNTKSAKAGDGIYLASTFPVVVGNRVMIPTGVYVQGTVDRVLRAGRVK